MSAKAASVEMWTRSKPCVGTYMEFGLYPKHTGTRSGGGGGYRSM